MDKLEIAAQIKSFLEDALPGHETELTYSTDLLNEWFVDSFGVVETVMFIEDKYKVNILSADVSVEIFKNINTISEFVTKMLCKKSEG